MPQDTVPHQQAAQRINDHWTVLPASFPVPGMGVLPVNGFLLTGSEPMLVDTGLSMLADDFVGALQDHIDPEDLRWIWLSHTDADHIGNLDRILEVAPKAQVLTNFLGAGKMGMMGVGDMARIRVLAPDEVVEIGGRRLHQVKPPYYDAPETMGFFDETDRVLFAADAFGALLPGPVSDIAEVDPDTLRDGLVGWSSIDAPWLTQIDREALGRTLSALERMDPALVFSGHLPVAHDMRGLTRQVADAYGHGATAAVTAEGRAAAEAVFE